MKGRINKAINAGFAVGMCDMIGIIGVQLCGVLPKHIDMVTLANNNGYQEANAIYRQVEIEELGQQLASGQISAGQFNSKVSQIQDLSVDYYMSSESVSAQAQEEYTILKNSKAACEYATVGLLGALLLDSIAITGGLVYAIKKKEKTEGVNTKEEPFVEL